MVITWGTDLLDTTQGLDILGVRGIDQAVELTLVNGITTISQRARYFSILPWALGDYLLDHATKGFDWGSLTVYLRRVEFITLAASILDREDNGADASGALGASLHQERLTSLLNGGSVTFPDETGGAMLGTYLAPCRAIGLLLDGDETVPYRLSPRGKEIWELRRQLLKASPVMTAISSGNQVSKAIVETAVPAFSLGSLVRSIDETRLLHSALVTPWEPANELEQIRVGKAYNGFNGTIAWANEMLTSEPDTAVGLIVRNFKDRTQQGTGTSIAFRWAEYEYRRRSHFALELLLAALTSSLAEFEEATTKQVVSEWLSSFEASPLMSQIWPEAPAARHATSFESVDSVPKQLFASTAVPTNDLRQLPANDQAYAAVALLAATASQTMAIRRHGYFDQKKATSPGERAISIVEAAGDESFSKLMENLVELTALSHLQTTLRKMGAGQKCSLRFFPDGPHLRSTGIGMSPGHSNDRLTNFLRILADLGKLQRANGKFAPADGDSA